MIDYNGVSLVLLIIWGISYYMLRNHATFKIYFILLFIMGIAGLILPMEYYLPLISKQFSFVNIVLFAFLMLSTLLPWSVVDNWVQNYKETVIYVNEAHIRLVKTICVATILLSLYAIIYAIPYAIIAYQTGAAEIRALLVDSGLMPVNIFTTICNGAGYLAPLQIVLFYISLSDIRLKNYRTWLFISTLTYLFTSAPMQARDGFIYIPLTYAFLFPIFKNSIEKRLLNQLKKYFLVIIPLAIIFLVVISLDRFYKNGSSQYKTPFDSFISGTYGYFYQQPYVFDNTIQYLDKFQGLGVRFPLICMIAGLPIDPHYVPYNASLETSFGTMYASFYSVSGFSSLFFISLIFIISWMYVFKKLLSQNALFSLVLVYSIFVYHVVSGLFYFRFSQVAPMVLYIFFICVSFFLPNLLKTKNLNQ